MISWWCGESTEYGFKWFDSFYGAAFTLWSRVSCWRSIDHLFISFFRKRIPASIACLRKERGKEKRYYRWDWVEICGKFVTPPHKIRSVLSKRERIAFFPHCFSTKEQFKHTLLTTLQFKFEIHGIKTSTISASSNTPAGWKSFLTSDEAKMANVELSTFIDDIKHAANSTSSRDAPLSLE